MNWAPKPPYRPIGPATASWYRRISPPSSSGSSFADSAVDPTISANITVTCRRSASPDPASSGGGDLPPDESGWAEEDLPANEALSEDEFGAPSAARAAIAFKRRR